MMLHVNLFGLRARRRHGRCHSPWGLRHVPAGSSMTRLTNSMVAWKGIIP